MYKDFLQRFKLLASKNQHLIVNTLSNIFTMRLIGNKTHGDLAEIGMAEFINQFMYDFKSVHVGKDLFRAKEHEEDIMIIDEISKEQFPVSLKAYGDGPLQLSTDSDQKMFPFLEKQGHNINGRQKIETILGAPEFADFSAINIMPLIYNEKKQQCNIMIFGQEKAKKSVDRIVYIGVGKKFDFDKKQIISRKGRSHPIFMFIDRDGNYICEVRYGGASANALQRGLWTHTQGASSYFESLTNGWIDYSHNLTLVKLFSLALNSSSIGHEAANKILQQDIERLKKI